MGGKNNQLGGYKGLATALSSRFGIQSKDLFKAVKKYTIESLTPLKGPSMLSPVSSSNKVSDILPGQTSGLFQF